MCFSAFLYFFLTEVTVHPEKKKESSMTFVPVSSNGNLYHSANHNSKKYKSLSQLHISQWSFILSFKKKSGFDPDRGMLFANFLSLAPADQKLSAYPLQNSDSICLEIKRS